MEVWAKSGQLPACISALALKETGSVPRRGLRKLEMRVAPCWREPSEHSLQVRGLDLGASRDARSPRRNRHRTSTRCRPCPPRWTVPACSRTVGPG